MPFPRDDHADVTAMRSTHSAGTPSRNAPDLSCSVCDTTIAPDEHVYRFHYPERREFDGRQYTGMSESIGPVCGQCYDPDQSTYGHKVKWRTNGPCAWCGRPVITAHVEHRRWLSCSGHCAYELKKEAQNQRRAHTVGKVHEHTCPCGTTFTTRRRSPRWSSDNAPTYCSSACRQRAHRQRRRPAVRGER